MISDLRILEPKSVWNSFADLCEIPRPSKHEEKVIEYLFDFAHKHNLWIEKDETGTVLIRKPATKGYEDRTPVVLQGHMDMVPQKNADVDHDFLKDPIIPVVDGDWVHASGTTLGADNGIGVSMALAVLAADDIAHGPLEALFTVDEETGMTGANNLKPGWLQAKYMLNFDSEEDGIFFIGCAGGVDFSAKLQYDFDSVPSNSDSFHIKLTGFKGGHSGVDIHLGRCNPILAMVRLLWGLSRSLNVRINSIEGGNMRNAIPRECVADVVVPSDKIELFEKIIGNYERLLVSEYENVETDIKIEIERILPLENVMDAASEAMLINALYVLPNGPMRMIPGTNIVETSNNFSILSVKEGVASVACLLRSSVESAKFSLAEKMRSLFELIGADIELYGNYPGWKPIFDSPLLKKAKETYKKLYGVEPKTEIMHAGLECGIIGSIFPEMQMLSLGPDLQHPHSPEERVSISTVKKNFEFVVALLAEL